MAATNLLCLQQDQHNTERGAFMDANMQNTLAEAILETLSREGVWRP